jgi:hypothetical protein
MSIVEYSFLHRHFYSSDAPCIQHQQGELFANKNGCLQEYTNQLRAKGISHIVVMMTKGEMDQYYSNDLLSLYLSSMLWVLHYPIDPSGVPDMESFVDLQERLADISSSGHVLFQSLYGQGRANLVLVGLIVAAGGNPQRARQLISMRNRHFHMSEIQTEFLFEYARIKGFDVRSQYA